MKTKTTNKNARRFVQHRSPFQGSNLYATYIKDLYAVFSYGEHFPLFIYDHTHNVWLENHDGYSMTTSKHRSQTHPHTKTIELTTEQMKAVLATGSIAAIVPGLGD